LAKPKITGTITKRVLPADFFSLFKKGAQLEAKKKVSMLAEDIAQEAKSIMEQQRYKWVPLSENYKAYKKRKGLDTRILIATRDYIDNGIGTYKKKDYVFVGPLPGRHKKSKLTYVQLSRYLEYGTTTMPARPLWRPLKSVVIRKSKILRAVYMKAMRKAFKDQLQKKVKSRKVK